MRGPEHLLLDGDGALEMRLRLGIAALLEIGDGQPVERIGCLDIVAAALALGQCQRPLRRLDRFGVLAGPQQLLYLAIESGDFLGLRE